MKQAKSRLNRKKVFKRKLIYGTFIVLSTIYAFHKINLNPVGAVVAPTFDIVEVEREVIREVEVPLKLDSDKQRAMAYIIEVFGDDASEMIAIVAKCENSTFNQEAKNHNRNGTLDKGVTQINSIHISGKEFKSCIEAHNDYRANIDCAKDIYDKYGWSAWSCSHVINETPFYLK
jgi:hypothetical protein